MDIPESPLSPLSPSGKPSKKSYLLLVSEGFGSEQQSINQDKAKEMLEGLPFSTLDGSDANNKDLRDELFSISGIHGDYPQLFLVKRGKSYYMGDFATMEEMKENGELEEKLVSSGMSPVSYTHLTLPTTPYV